LGKDRDEMKISAMSIIKNESQYIGYSIMSVLDYVDELVYFDGNSTDGTIEIIEYIQKKYDKDKKIKLFKNKDFKNFNEDYTRLNNECLSMCTGDYIWFLHPDMVVLNPEKIKIDGKFIRYFVNVNSIAGENAELVMTSGRTGKWYTIYKNDLGLHYHGFYGSPDEDFYFRAITGDEHVDHQGLKPRPYAIQDSGITLNHYCETKPYDRRLEKMKKVLKLCFPNMSDKDIDVSAKEHPRVNLGDGVWNKVLFTFEKNKEVPEVFKKHKKEFEPLRRVRA
jgi:glycosyltransferase involved in cell wall biosynthesis